MARITNATAPEWIVEALSGGVMGDGTVMSLGVGHNGHADDSMGTLMNVHDVFGAAEAAGLDAEGFLTAFMADMDHFNDPRHVDWWYPAASLAVMNDLTAAVTMGGLDGDHGTLELIQGAATQAAFRGDADDLRAVLAGAGGDPGPLSDAQLLAVWGTNSHHYNHNALRVHADDGANLGFKITHLRSLNDHALDGTEPGTRGGYNDRGEYPEWYAGGQGGGFGEGDDGFYDKARAFLDEMAGILPDGYEASGALEARNGGEVVRETPTDVPATPDMSEDDGDLVFAFETRDDWGTGSVLDLVITNEGGTAATDWAVSFDLAPDITAHWNADVTNGRGDGRTVVEDAGDGWTIDPGATVRWAGFVVDEGGLDAAALNAAAGFDLL